MEMGGAHGSRAVALTPTPPVYDVDDTLAIAIDIIGRHGVA